MSKTYMGRFGIGYLDLKNIKQNQIQEIRDYKEAVVGQCVFNIGHHGEAIYFTPSAAQKSTKSYRVYLSCRNMPKETNQVSWAFGDNKKSGSTEKVTKTDSPSFDKYLALDEINENADFSISFLGSDKK